MGIHVDKILVVAEVKSGAMQNVIPEKHNFRESPFKFQEVYLLKCFSGKMHISFLENQNVMCQKIPSRLP